MLVEIPDPGVILGMVAAFLAGVGGLFLYHRIRPLVGAGREAGSGHSERLEYYERQLIDMKIRLDAMELQGIGQEGGDPGPELERFVEKPAEGAAEGKPAAPESPAPAAPQAPKPAPAPGSDANSIVERVLHLVTHKAMTSRDIQATLRRSREHTSRLMKKLFDDGYVDRTRTKPYAYSLTQKGREKISVAGPKNAAVASPPVT